MNTPPPMQPDERLEKENERLKADCAVVARLERDLLAERKEVESLMLKSVLAMSIAGGEDNWEQAFEKESPPCPMLEAVAQLRRDHDVHASGAKMGAINGLALKEKLRESENALANAQADAAVMREALLLFQKIHPMPHTVNSLCGCRGCELQNKVARALTPSPGADLMARLERYKEAIEEIEAAPQCSVDQDDALTKINKIIKALAGKDSHE